MINIQITKKASVKGLHDDSHVAAGLSELGQFKIKRASHVEPEPSRGLWFVRSAKTRKILASGFKTRAEALTWEKDYYSPQGKGWKELC